MSKAEPIRIDIISDVVCPWCIIGFKQLEQAIDRTGIAATIHWHPFELNPDMPKGGEHLTAHVARKYGASEESSRRARDRLTALGAELGFTFNYDDDFHILNTFKAHQLIRWSHEFNQAHAVKLALFAAYFTDARDISDTDVLVEIAQGVGLNGAEARDMLNNGRFGDEVRQVETFWMSRGIEGVPATIFAGRYLMSGAQGVDAYAAVLKTAAEERHASARPDGPIDHGVSE